MSFLYPLFLYLMLPLLLILFYFIFTGKKVVSSVFSDEVLKKLRSNQKALPTSLRQLLFLLAFICMSVALAQPVLKEGEITVEAKSADILIGIDISDSMLAQDRYPNRLEFSKNKAIALLKEAPHNRMGVIAFAKHDYIVSPLSFDHSSVAFLLSKLNTQSITEKGTRLDLLLETAANALNHADQKNLLLFSDGGDREDFDVIIKKANKHNLRLFIIGVGSDKGSPIRKQDGSFIKHQGNILISRLNENIKELAIQTGGVYIESTVGNADIKAMINEITKINEKETLKAEVIPQYTQLFYYPLALSLLFVLLALSSLPRRQVLVLPFLFVLSVDIPEASAGLLDFKTIEEAKKAYDSKDYEASARLYNTLDSTPEAVYNHANSLYKTEQFEQALEEYQSINSAQSDLQAKVLHNQGNTQAKLGQFQEALKSYEEALAIKEDEQTRENYMMIKKLLEEQPQQNNQQDQQNNQENTQKQSTDNKEHDTSKQDKQQQSGKQEKDKETSEQKSQQKSDMNESSEENNDTSNQPDKDQEKGSVTKQDQHQEEQKSDGSTQKSEAKKDEENELEKKSADMAVSEQKMSDLEAQKWMQVIKASQQGHLYKMKTSEYEEDENEKPW